MKQTDQYGLNQWELTDRIQMEDFNADNLKIAAALAGKMGRFEEIYSHSSEGIADSMSFNHLVRNWNEWDMFGFLLHLKISQEFADVSLQVSFDCKEGQTTTHLEVACLPPASLLILLFPWHDENRLVEGVIIGGGTKVFQMSFPFKQLGFIRFVPVNGVKHYFQGSCNRNFGLR